MGARRDLTSTANAGSEVAYTTFRDNKFGNLGTYFEIGANGAVNPTF
jgi:hypothetical protein